MEDSAIVALYWARDEQAVQETAQKYGAYCHTIAYNVVRNRQDAEECVNDTYVQAWNAMPPQKPTVLRAFLGKITRNLSLSVYRAGMAQCRGGGEIPLALEELSECIGQDNDTERKLEARELGRTLTAFLRTEPRNSRVIFLRRYYHLESSREIAQHLGISDSHVRLQLSRTRKKLKAYLKKEGYFL